MRDKSHVDYKDGELSKETVGKILNSDWFL